MTQTKTKEREAKDKFNQLTDYKEEVLNKVKEHFTPVSNYVILKPTVIKKIGQIELTQPKVSPVCTILSVGPECKVAKPGMKAILNFAHIGSIAMYKMEIDGTMFLSLLESQLNCVYPGDVTILEEEGIDKPELKQDGGLAFSEEPVKTDLILPKSGIIM